MSLIAQKSREYNDLRACLKLHHSIKNDLNLVLLLAICLPVFD